MKPLNNYIQIEPEAHQDFIASVNSTYDEIGIVVSVADGVTQVFPGDRVYFDSWMAAKFPAGEGNHYWLVPFDNVKAFEPLSKQSVQGRISARLRDHLATPEWAPGEMHTLRDEDVLSSKHAESQIHGVSRETGPTSK